MLLVGRYVDIEYTPLLFGNSTPMATFHLLLVGSTDTYWEKKWRALLPAPEPPAGRHRCCLPHTTLISPPRLQSPPSTRWSATFSCQQHVSDAASESSTLVSLHHKKSQFWQASSLNDWLARLAAGFIWGPKAFLRSAKQERSLIMIQSLCKTLTKSLPLTLQWGFSSSLEPSRLLR